MRRNNIFTLNQDVVYKLASSYRRRHSSIISSPKNYPTSLTLRGATVSLPSSIHAGSSYIVMNFGYIWVACRAELNEFPSSKRGFEMKIR